MANSKVYIFQILIQDQWWDPWPGIGDNKHFLIQTSKGSLINFLVVGIPESPPQKTMSARG